MTDHLTTEKRSWNMSRIRGKDTSPELKIRRYLHSLGYRFRLHRSDLPGKPDIVLPKHKTVIFVNGCFWHHNENCKKAAWPKTNKAFWKEKIEQNIKRDKRNILELEKMNWKLIVVWECEVNEFLRSSTISSILNGEE